MRFKEFVESLGSRIEYSSYNLWKDDLPKGSTFHNDRINDKIQRAQAIGKDYEGVAGTWDHEADKGWIYAYYLKKENLREVLDSRTDFGKGKGIDVGKMKLVTKANVAAGKLGSINLPIIGVTMKQVQSTGDTSSPEIKMPKYKTK